MMAVFSGVNSSNNMTRDLEICAVDPSCADKCVKNFIEKIRPDTSCGRGDLGAFYCVDIGALQYKGNKEGCKDSRDSSLGLFVKEMSDKCGVANPVTSSTTQTDGTQGNQGNKFVGVITT